jgi:DNA-directed RNA polymerase subunit M/transcription elongation factor TFIIS
MADAQDLEHACCVISDANGGVASYQQLVFTLLWVLEQRDKLADSVLELTRTENAMSALSITNALDFPSASVCFEVSSRDQKYRECKKLVEDLAASGGANGLVLPKAGVMCTNCKCFEISFEFSQTRSADEGMTVFCYCTKCEKRWTM